MDDQRGHLHGCDCVSRERSSLSTERNRRHRKIVYGEERKTRQIARREHQMAAAGRMLATSFFNTAVAYFNLSQFHEARSFASKVADDDQFAERARELLKRLVPHLAPEASRFRESDLPQAIKGERPHLCCA